MVIQVALRNKAKESATILDDSRLEAYNDSIQRLNPKLREYLGRYGQSDIQLTGSSPLMNVHWLDSGLLPEDARISTRDDLEAAISRANGFLHGFYTNFGVALETAGDSYPPNDLLAKILTKELGERGISLETGKLILLNALSLQEDSDSYYGAVFRLNDRAGKDNILDLDDYKWDRSRKEGLACAYLNGGRYWDFYCGRLVDSDGAGRVVVVSGEATSQKFLDRYASKFKEDRDRKIAQIQKEYAEREANLRIE